MAKKKTEREVLEIAFRNVAETESGYKVLRAFLAFSRYQDPLITVNHMGEVNPLTSIYNTARRDFWLEVRQFLPAALLAKIENPTDIPAKPPEVSDDNRIE